MTGYREIPESLLDLIYDAAAEPQLWNRVLSEIAKLVDGASGMLLIQAVPSSQLLLDRITGLDEAAMRAYKERHIRNAWSLHMHDKRVGTIATSEEIMPLAQLQRTDFFNDVLRPQKLGHGAMNILVSSTGFAGGMCVNRETSRGAFSGAELNLLRRLLPHLRRSLKLGFRFDAYRVLQEAGFEAIDRLTAGVVLLDRKAHVVFANKAATRLAAMTGQLRLGAGRLDHLQPSWSRRLEKLVHTAMGGEPVVAGALPVQSGGRPLLAVAIPLRSRDVDRFAAASIRDVAVMVFLCDPEPRDHVPPEWLSAAFGLTPSEAKVAITASHSSGVPEIAQRLRLSPNTVKTHLAHVFNKTGANGHAALTGLVTSLQFVGGRVAG